MRKTITETAPDFSVEKSGVLAISPPARYTVETMKKTEEKQTKVVLYSNTKITRLPDSEVEITGEIVAEKLAPFRKDALEYIGKHAELDGFRKGKVPEKILVAKVGEMAVLEEMAEIAISKMYPDLLVEHKIDAIGRPEIALTKIAVGSDLSFKIKTAVMPEVILPDYKKIAAKENAKPVEKIIVTEKEVDDVILEVRKSRVDHTGHDHAKMSKEDHDKAVEASLPVFDDAFVKTVGDFKDVADFKVKITENIQKDKEHKANEKKRIEIAEAVIKETKADLPKVIIEAELDKMEAQFNDDITRMGIKAEDYMKHIKKTREEMRAEWRPDAVKRATLQIVLHKIAETEKIVADKDRAEKEIKAIFEHYPDADLNRIRGYVESMLVNEQVFDLLVGKK